MEAAPVGRLVRRAKAMIESGTGRYSDEQIILKALAQVCRKNGIDFMEIIHAWMLGYEKLFRLADIMRINPVMAIMNGDKGEWQNLVGATTRFELVADVIRYLHQGGWTVQNIWHQLHISNVSQRAVITIYVYDPDHERHHRALVATLRRLIVGSKRERRKQVFAALLETGVGDGRVMEILNKALWSDKNIVRAAIDNQLPPNRVYRAYVESISHRSPKIRRWFIKTFGQEIKELTVPSAVASLTAALSAD